MNTELLEALALVRAGQWEQAHEQVQRLDTADAAWLHALIHLQEGDADNAAYWYRRAGRDFNARRGLAEELDTLERHLRGPAAPD